MEKSIFKESLSLLWRNCKSGIQLMHSVHILRQVTSPLVTIFGGARVEQDNSYAKQAYELGKKLVEEHFAILTGGGPGIMVSANCGALHAAEQKNNKQLWSIGIGVKGVDEQFHNPCARFITVDTFEGRKWLLMRYSIGIIVLPGGIGTANELFEVFNALKHHYINIQPIIFIGSQYWQPLFDWINNMIIDKGYATAETKEFFTVTDSIDHAVALIKKRSN